MVKEIENTLEIAAPKEELSRILAACESQDEPFDLEKILPFPHALDYRFPEEMVQAAWCYMAWELAGWSDVWNRDTLGEAAYELMQSRTQEGLVGDFSRWAEAQCRSLALMDEEEMSERLYLEYLVEQMMKGIQAYNCLEEGFCALPLPLQYEALLGQTDPDRGDEEPFSSRPLMLYAGCRAVYNLRQYGEMTRQDWCLKVWGTDGLCRKSKVTVSADGCRARVRLITRWSAPVPLVEQFALEYPETEFTWEFWEDETGFAGKLWKEAGSFVVEYEDNAPAEE